MPQAGTYVVLRRNAPVEVAVQPRDLRQNVLSHTRHLSKEKERENTSSDGERAGNGTTVASKLSTDDVFARFGCSGRLTYYLVTLPRVRPWK